MYLEEVLGIISLKYFGDILRNMKTMRYFTCAISHEN